MSKDDLKVKIREENKKILVEQEIEAHPVFKALMRNTKNNHIGLMVSSIVDRYFELAPKGDNVFKNGEFYKVNSSIIRMALAQTCYLISVEENGLVLLPDGEIDTKSTLEQKYAVAYNKSKVELTPEERMELARSEQYKLDLEFQSKVLKEPSIQSRYDELLEFTSEYSRSYTIHERAKKIENDLKTEETQTAKLNVESKVLDATRTKEDVELLDFALELVNKSYSSSQKNSNVSNILDKMSDNDKSAKLKNESGEIDEQKVAGYVKKVAQLNAERKYIKNLTNFVTDFSKDKYNNMDPKAQAVLLETIYTFCNSKEPKFKELGFKAATLVSNKLIVKNDRKRGFHMDTEVFANLYNATHGDRDNTYGEIEAIFRKKRFDMVVELNQKLKQKIEKGEFIEFDETVGNSEEDISKLNKSAFEKIRKSKKPKLKLNEKEKVSLRIERSLNKIKNPEEKAKAVIIAYKQLLDKQNVSEIDNDNIRILRDYIKSNADQFGKYIDEDRIKTTGIEEAEKDDKYNKPVNAIISDVTKMSERIDLRENHKGSFKNIVANVGDAFGAVGNVVYQNIMFFKKNEDKLLLSSAIGGTKLLGKGEKNIDKDDSNPWALSPEEMEAYDEKVTYSIETSAKEVTTQATRKSSARESIFNYLKNEQEAGRCDMTDGQIMEYCNELPEEKCNKFLQQHGITPEGKSDRISENNMNDSKMENQQRDTGEEYGEL